MNEIEFFSNLRDQLIDAPLKIKQSFNTVVQYFADDKKKDKEKDKEDKNSSSDKDAVNEFYTALAAVKPKLDRKKSKELLEMLNKVESLIIKKY